MKLIATKVFRAQKILTEWQEREILSAEKLAEQVNQFMPASALIDYSEYDGGIHFEHVGVYLQDSPKYCVRKFKEKYYVVNHTNYPNVDSYGAKRATEHLKQPNYIGVFTAKKLKDWVDYLNAEHEILTALSIGANKRETEFLEKLNGLPVQWYSDKKSGRIVRNGIEYIFTIKDGNIYQNMEIHCSASSTLETFLQLSDNKFVSPKN